MKGGRRERGGKTIVTLVGVAVIRGPIEWAKTENGSMFQLAKPVRAYAS